MNLGKYAVEQDFVINNMDVSIVPAKVPLEEYHHEVSFDQLSFFGVQANDLKFVGKGNLGELDEFDIEG
jgi:hypothetical protein